MLPPRYELHEQLRADSHGVSYRAFDRDTERPVEIRIWQTVDEFQWEAIQRRCRLAELIDSPYVRRVRALELESKPAYLVIDPASEQSLEDLWADQRPVATPSAVRILHRITLPLIAAHRVGSSHGQLLPSEIGWTGHPESEDCACCLDFTPRPANLQGSLAEDILRLSRLWEWLTAGAEGDSPADWQGLSELLQSMQSPEPARRPTAMTVATTL
ncbi:MAG: hypothetical protein JSS02_01425, partial [Planctomycetes bacterium]|nr:hypothetical protein [Planctomycetota bacterium]